MNGELFRTKNPGTLYTYTYIVRVKDGRKLQSCKFSEHIHVIHHAFAPLDLPLIPYTCTLSVISLCLCGMSPWSTWQSCLREELSAGLLLGFSEDHHTTMSSTVHLWPYKKNAMYFIRSTILHYTVYLFH